MTTGYHIKRLRMAQMLSQTDLAAKLQMTRQRIHQLESDINAPGTQTIHKLCNALGCTPNDLLGYETKNA